jgi:hypothetical protein
MGEYSGKDGWVFDENGARRVPNKENVQEPAERPKPPPKKPTKPLRRCPNCNQTFSWRRMENRCTLCGWKGGEVEQKSTNDDGINCCLAIGIFIAVPLIGMGIGYMVGGFGGLLAGLGIGIGLLVVVLIAGITLENERKANASEGQRSKSI